MMKWTRWPLAAALLAFAASAGAEQTHDAQPLLARVAGTYRGLERYHFEGSTTVVVNAAQNQTFDVPFIMAGAPNGRRRTDLRNPYMSILAVSNGESTWTFAAQLNQYTRTAMTPAKTGDSSGASLTEQVATMDPLLGYKTVADHLKSARVLRSDTLTVDGRRVPCQVIEAEYDMGVLPPGLEIQPKKFWIDPERNLLLQSLEVVRRQVQDGSTVENRQSTVFKHASINQPVPDSLFTFQAPPGAALVDHLGPAPPPTPALAGKPSIDFTLSDLKGRPHTLSHLRGKVVMLDFWATWCGPCRIEMPHVAKLAREFKARGLVVLGVNLRETASVVRPFLKVNSYDMTVLLDRNGAVAEKYQANAIPTLVVIDRTGKIARYYTGVTDEAELRAALKSAGL